MNFCDECGWQLVGGKCPSCSANEEKGQRSMVGVKTEQKKEFESKEARLIECPNCGAKSYVPSNGCFICMQCGHTGCE